MKREGSTKQKLLDVAIKLLWEQSYGAVGVDDICKKAGVTKGSFYFAFPSKSDLACAALEEYWVHTKRPLMDAIFSVQLPAMERFEKFCDLVIDDQLAKFKEYGKMCGCPGTSVGCELSTSDEKVRLKVEELAERIIRYQVAAVSALQAEGLIPQEDPQPIARQIYDFVTGLLTQAKIENDPEALKRLRPGLFRILGLKMPTGSVSTSAPSVSTV
jgi:TetR/AcrR family transcriptional repressor of nem operon